MKKAILVGGIGTVVLVLLAIATVRWVVRRDATTAGTESPGDVGYSTAHGVDRSYIYGRITTIDGVGYEGRIRFGGGEEAFWSDFFNGVKLENPWAAEVPPGELPKDRDAIEIFGVRIFEREEPVDLARPFMVRFGDMVRVASQGRDVYVTLKSEAVIKLDQFSASDFDDGVRVWDQRHGIVDLDSLRVRDIEFREAPGSANAPGRLFGTVSTKQGTFTGFLQWNRRKNLGSDIFDGRSDGKAVRVPFDTIQAIARRSQDGALVTLRDGREMVVSGTRDAGEDNLGIYVDDPRYGRVLVSWDAFKRVAFGAEGPGKEPRSPAYDDFPQAGPLMGAVTTRTGRRIAGRLVYDLDECEAIETLDAPSGGIDYSILFGMIATIVLPRPEMQETGHATITLHTGEELILEDSGDLSRENAGMLVFGTGRQDVEYVRWGDVARIDLDKPPAMLVTGGPFPESR